MIPRVGEGIRQGRRYRARPGVYAILPRAGRILTVVQVAGKVDVMLPGGGVDPGEQPLHALHREVMEETGWCIARPRRLGAFRRYVYMPEYDLWAEKICAVYVARPVRQVADPTEPDHFPAFMSPLDALASLNNEGDRWMLDRYLAPGPR